MAPGKICLIYTGGTIGMVTDSHGIHRPPADSSDFLKVAPELDEITDYEFVRLLNKDSTNMVPADWMKMADAIFERRNDGYDGFVIAHGTDTMHFSASALAFALGPKLNFPVVFTGAQTTPEVRHGDARVNLLRAVKVAKEPLAEVVIAFGDYVFRGCRTQKKDEKRFDAFESPALYPIADITEKVLLHPTARRRVTEVENGELDLRNNFAEGILQVGLIPGMSPKLLEPLLEAGGCKGIVLQSFGAGNVPDEKDYAFEPFIRRATDCGVPVVITSQFPANSTLETKYAPGVKAIEAGAIPTGNMTSAAATVKFRWAIAAAEHEIEDGTLAAGRKVARIREIISDIYILEMD